MAEIVTHLWYDKEAVEAAELYISIFPESRIDNIGRIEDTPSGDCDIVEFTLAGRRYIALSAGPMFRFNEAVSLLVPCETQYEIDYYWERLSANPSEGQCGWTKDRFGLSWQVWPTILRQMLSSHDKGAKARLLQVVRQSKRFILADLVKAFEG